MASSPVKFLFVFLLISIVGWVVFIFFSRLLTWFLSRILGASVQLRVAGCNCLRDVNVKFKKGAVDSISVGEIKLSLRKSLVKLGFSFISRDPKLRLLISDLEIVIRAPEKRARGKHGSRQKSRTISKGKWMLVASVARFFSVSITDLVVKAPQVTVDIKDLMVDMSKLGHSNSLLLIKLHLLPILINVCDRCPSFEQMPDNNLLGGLPAGQSLSAKSSAPFICEDLSLVCELGHERDVGVKVRDLDVTCGVISMSIDESLLVKSKTKSDISQSNNSEDRSCAESSPDKESQNDDKSHLSRRKPALLLPDKLQFAKAGLHILARRIPKFC